MWLRKDSDSERTKMLKYYHVSDTKWVICGDHAENSDARKNNNNHSTRNCTASRCAYEFHISNGNYYLRNRAVCAVCWVISLREQWWPGRHAASTTSSSIYGVIKINYVVICFGFIAMTRWPLDLFIVSLYTFVVVCCCLDRCTRCVRATAKCSNACMKESAKCLLFLKSVKNIRINRIDWN